MCVRGYALFFIIAPLLRFGGGRAGGRGGVEDGAQDRYMPLSCTVRGTATGKVVKYSTKYTAARKPAARGHRGEKSHLKLNTRDRSETMRYAMSCNPAEFRGSGCVSLK